MTWTTSKVIACAVGACCLAATLTGLTIWWITPSNGSRDVPLAGNQQVQTTAETRPGMTLRQYPVADTRALAEMEGKIKTRQDTKDTIGETTINLKNYVNAKLTDPLADQPAEKEHTMAELPEGIHIYAGVPFDVEGLIQLNGPSVETGAQTWQTAVPNIAVGHLCRKLHLLQGAFNIVAPGAHIAFAKLVVHYADGSQNELELSGGDQALRCVDAQVPHELDLLQAPRTELAWVGTNPYLKKNNPTALLHLYRTTFDNPKPDVQITSIDYLSTMVNPAPFLAGLTLE